MVRMIPPSSGPTVPDRLGSLSGTEQRVWAAFPHGELVDLRTGDPALDDPAEAAQWSADRAVRAEVIAALLLGACPPAVGAVAALRLAGARITGELRIDHGQITAPLLLRECRVEGRIDLDGATTGAIDLRGSRLTAISVYSAVLRGPLDLSDTVITGLPFRAGAGPGVGLSAVYGDGVRIEGGLFVSRARVNGVFSLINAQVSGQLTLIGARLFNTAPGGKSLNAGGIRIGRSLLAQGLWAKGELRLPGAHIGSSLVLNGARLDGLGAAALHADDLLVASEAIFRPHVSGRSTRAFTAVGTVRIPWSRFGNDLDLRGARLTPSPDQPALEAERILVEGSLRLGTGLRTTGEIRLTAARITSRLDLTGMASPDALLSLYAATAEGGIREEFASWPSRLNLDGFTYGPFTDYQDAVVRIPLMRRQVRRTDDTRGGGYRAQPYEQLASYYRTLGDDGEARTVLLAKQRALRAKLVWWRRIPGHVLDLLVGYGYRPLRAIGWAVALLTASSVYFGQVRPDHVATDDRSVFNPVLYSADHLVPVIHFGQPEVWQYHGVPAAVTVVLTILGWTLGIAIAAAATRTLTRA
ncbi:hypothetical protein [Streptacidiphilus sp. PAMC 29251]